MYEGSQDIPLRVSWTYILDKLGQTFYTVQQSVTPLTKKRFQYNMCIYTFLERRK